MRKVYVRELKPYSLAALVDLLQVTPARAREMVEQLMMRGGWAIALTAPMTMKTASPMSCISSGSSVLR